MQRRGSLKQIHEKGLCIAEDYSYRIVLSRFTEDIQKNIFLCVMYVSTFLTCPWFKVRHTALVARHCINMQLGATVPFPTINMK